MAVIHSLKLKDSPNDTPSSVPVPVTAMCSRIVMTHSTQESLVVATAKGTNRDRSQDVTVAQEAPVIAQFQS